MKSFVCVDLFVLSVVLLALIFGLSAAELEQSKNRRGGGGGSSGLFAFPRVGRGDPSLQNPHEAGLDRLLYSTSYEEYEEELPKVDMKRASLIAFPRVGRNDAEIRRWAQRLALQQALDKRSGSSATTGLWFGPRLGKRSVSVEAGHEGAPKSEGQMELY